MKVLKKEKKVFLAVIIFALFVIFSGLSVFAADTGVSLAKKKQISSGEFEYDENGISFRYSNGKCASSVWFEYRDHYYYASPDGYLKTGWFKYNKKWYYAAESGYILVSKWLTEDGETYYLKKDGTRAQKEWIKKSQKTYYFNADGTRASEGMKKIGTKYYYFDSKGYKKTNCFVSIKGKRYYFNNNGVRCQKKWVKYKGKYYYFQKNGVMETEAWVGSYYVGEDGARMTNCYVDGVYLGSSGQKLPSLKFDGKYLFVGDSRTVGMDNTINSSKSKFIGKVGAGYTWLKSTAGPTVRRYLAGNENLTVFFLFGVNDCGNINQYISYYRSLMQEFPNANIYFMTVGPIQDALASANGYYATNSMVCAFNNKLTSAFGKKVLPLYGHLVSGGFSSVDGIHYTAATYQKIYQYAVSKA